ncbi:MAG: hypothetical protein ACRDTG_29395 [Pseudonocardiaceae bacterium]
MSYHPSDTRISPESRDRIIRGGSVVRELNALDGVWVGRIRAPGQKRSSGERFTIHQTVFVRTLRPVLDMPLLAKVRPTQIALLLNSYWDGIAKILPEPFDPAGDPKNYVIQQNQGAVALHHVLPWVIEVLPAWGRSLTDPIAYADVMHDLPTLGGEIIRNHGASPVPGATFWLSGSAGMASQFSDDAGRKRLLSHLRALIPRPPKGLEI